ncbi:MAG: malonyl-CoA synthase [Gammaproteobacteria bacterium]|jgi:malonyl-CoA/methylmalonyl-CoA synthetase|nr:malonyl-CoA synthase [Gammaproteobacteria bacterium]|tara:strand:- start:2367 stop:3869 length:1503 start_codon:yes stop_codon:yes gene_type:complete
MPNIYRLFHEGTKRGGDFILDADGTTLATYKDLETRSARYANRLAGLGLNKGDRVMVQVEKSAESLFLYFACLRAGLIYLPLNTAYQRSELEYFIGNSSPKLVICAPASEALFTSICSTSEPAICVQTLDGEGKGSIREELGNQADTFADQPCDDRDIAAILYTSGTTGQPKGAMISHGNLEANLTTLHKAWGFTGQDVLLHALPIFHVHGLFVATHLAVLNASPIVFLPKFDAQEITRLLPHASVYMGVPTNYTRLLSNPEFGKGACRNMRLFTAGSAPLLPQTFDEFKHRTGHTIVERYGMTETGMNTSNPLKGARKAGTVGLPLQGVSCKIIDSAGNPMEINETGSLLVKGPNVFSGYWQLPEKTQEEFTADGYFRTGDLACRDEDGYISIVGRGKDLIITGGFNVYPREVENVIDKMHGVDESAVIGLPHSDYGEAVTAIIVRSEGSDIDEKAIIQHLKATLANFKVAKQVLFVDTLPRNTMGKVQKNVLREQFKQ